MISMTKYRAIDLDQCSVEQHEYSQNTDKVMFESPDDLIAESHFWKVAVIGSRSLTVVATTEVFV